MNRDDTEDNTIYKVVVNQQFLDGELA